MDRVRHVLALERDPDRDAGLQPRVRLIELQRDIEEAREWYGTQAPDRVTKALLGVIGS